MPPAVTREMLSSSGATSGAASVSSIPMTMHSDGVTMPGVDDGQLGGTTLQLWKRRAAAKALLLCRSAPPLRLPALPTSQPLTLALPLPLPSPNLLAVAVSNEVRGLRGVVINLGEGLLSEIPVDDTVRFPEAAGTAELFLL